MAVGPPLATGSRHPALCLRAPYRRQQAPWMQNKP